MEPTDAGPTVDRRDRYETFMEVIRARMTNRSFVPHEVPTRHVEQILEAARHGPSGANCQPWHFIVVRSPETKAAIGDLFVEEQQRRAKLGMGFPTPNYTGMRTAPGLIVIATDFRFVRAFPVLAARGGSPAASDRRCIAGLGATRDFHHGLLDEDSTEGRMYAANAERILLQSVAAATMSAHLAAAALGYAVWWITAIGQSRIQEAIRPMLALPEELSPIDIMCFGRPLKPSYRRWKKPLTRIVSWDRFDPTNLMSDEQVTRWIEQTRHKVMYRDESKID